MSISNMHWRSISVKYVNASLDFKKGSAPIMTKTANELAEAVEALIMAGGGSKLIAGIIAAMIQSAIVKKFFDYYTSPLLGPKTQRLNFVFPLYIVVPFESDVICTREEIKAVGKSGTVGGRSVLSNFELDVVINSIPADMISGILKEHPSWFVGNLEYLTSRKLSPTSNEVTLKSAVSKPTK
ncbi:TPA_asm: M [Artemisia alphacytorhabdovirus 2]|nr:TPA_asm: M [Artemisia alphacytorhabdovirus 2]